MFTRSNVQGKLILITGAGNGIGRELALQLHGLGAIVALIDRDAEALKCVAFECGARSGGFAPFRVCDIANRLDTRAAIRGLALELGNFDVVIANAGIAKEAPLIGGTSVLEQTLAVNVMGTDHTVNAAMPYLKKGGYILLTSSLGAAINLPLMGAYSLSKAAIEVYANTLRIELKGTGIRVGTAFYAQLDTAMTKGFDSAAAKIILGRRYLQVLHRVAPLQPAIDAIIKGIELRLAVIVSPRRTRVIRLFRAPLQWVVERWVGDVRDALEVSRSQLVNS